MDMERLSDMHMHHLFKNRAAYDWSVETTIYVDKDVNDRESGKNYMRH